MTTTHQDKKFNPRYLILHALCWSVLIVVPMFFHSSGDDWMTVWNRYIRWLGNPQAYMLVFYLNYLWIVPRFLLKKRDWKTGKILGIDIAGYDDLKGKNILMVDDICAYGGTNTLLP